MVTTLALLAVQFVETGWSHCQHRVGVFFSSERFTQNKFTHISHGYICRKHLGGVPATPLPHRSFTDFQPQLCSSSSDFVAHIRKFSQFHNQQETTCILNIFIFLSLFFFLLCCPFHFNLSSNAKKKKSDSFRALNVHAEQKTI